MLSEYESERLKGVLTYSLKRKSLREIISTINDFVEKYQEEVEWNIRDYAIISLKGIPMVILSAWLGKEYESKIALILAVVTKEGTPPNYVISAMETWFPVLLSFDSIPFTKRRLVADWVKLYFDLASKKVFFETYPEMTILIGETV